jgi:chemotaxis signal transduction protein
MSARTAFAWLLEYAPGRCAAFGAQSALSLVEAPAVVYVPGAPVHCLGLMCWEAHRLALLDLGLLCAPGASRPEAAQHALVIAWQAHGGHDTRLGAIAAPALARMIEVSDAHACAAPAGAGALRRIALSWFEHEGQPVPVVDTARLFS